MRGGAWLAIAIAIVPTRVRAGDNWKDTFSIRLGAAYNIPIRTSVLSIRAGGFYDSSASENADTRLDFDTLSKVGVTAGLGVRVRGIKLDLAYAYMAEPERIVTDGRLLPTVPHTPTAPLEPINNGRYTARTQVVSIGISVTWDQLLKKERTPKYAADWEVLEEDASGSER